MIFIDYSNLKNRRKYVEGDLAFFLSLVLVWFGFVLGGDFVPVLLINL